MYPGEIGVVDRFVKSSQSKVQRDMTRRGNVITLAIENPNEEALLKVLRNSPKEFSKAFGTARRKLVQKILLPEIRERIPKSDTRKKHLRGTVRALGFKVDTTRVRVGSKDRWYASIVHNVSKGPSIRHGRLPQPFYDLALKAKRDKFNRELDTIMGKFTRWLASGAKGKLRL